jgi:hypothetical protein
MKLKTCNLLLAHIHILHSHYHHNTCTQINDTKSWRNPFSIPLLAPLASSPFQFPYPPGFPQINFPPL